MFPSGKDVNNVSKAEHINAHMDFIEYITKTDGISPDKKAELLSRLDGLVLKKNFEPYFKIQWTLPKINLEILKKIKKPLEAHKKGWVYMFQRKNLPHMVKIGFTESQPGIRVKQQMKACKFEVEFQKHYEVDNPQKVESLIHAELRLHRRKELSCNGKDACSSKKKAKRGEGNREHGEWFEITTEKAVNVMSRWVKWMECEPYSRFARLKEKSRTKWEYPLKKFAHNYVATLLRCRDPLARGNPLISGCDDWHSWVEHFAGTEIFKKDATCSETATVRIQKTTKVRRVLTRSWRKGREKVTEEVFEETHVYDEDNQRDDQRELPRRSRRIAAY